MSDETYIDPPSEAAPQPEPAPALSPRDRLKAFEDEKFGKDCVRIAGKIEKFGSAYRLLSVEDQARHTALENLIDAHDKVDAAAAALVEAENAAAAAELVVDHG